MNTRHATHPAAVETPLSLSSGDLLARYQSLRSRSDALVSPLGDEDMVVQAMPDASPAKWHLAHTTWFFETFLLSVQVPGYRVFDPVYGYLFNSYYEALGPRQPRPQRGLLTRPRVAEVIAYRHYVDQHMATWLRAASPLEAGVRDLVLLGFAHEEQHQELLLMDILSLFGKSPVKPAYDAVWPADEVGREGGFKRVDGGVVQIGAGGDGFHFDNERPRHATLLQPFEIADRLVTNGQWLAFMADGAYQRAELWLSDAWSLIQAEGWEAPLYWERAGEAWQRMTLRGLEPVDPRAAVTHISYYEAAAYALWAGARLPTEAEWEVAASTGALEQSDGVAWQWTQSAYGAYPGFRAASGAVGEYNGKFMVGQMVLRGGASVTPPGHTRPSYRNFFRPEQRWMFSGLRLARDLDETMPSHDAEPRMDENSAESTAAFAADVIAGLSLKNKALSPKYFYDAAGSDLFEAICELDEYYPTRTESALLQAIAHKLSADIPDEAVLVEFGSGASDKTRVILDAAPQIAAYVPIDISVDALDKAAARLKQHYPALSVAPLAGDFTQVLQLPAAVRARPKVGFFPGSTIGNFTPAQAVDFLRSVRSLLGEDALLIVGADLVKDAHTLVAAYDDAAGVTAQFNKNLLLRINRELQGDFDPDAFDHLAIWNAGERRMEMHLVSRADQLVNAAGHTFAFKAGERLHTENSHKFTTASFAELAVQGGWSVEREWVSAAPQFAIFSLRA